MKRAMEKLVIVAWLRKIGPQKPAGPTTDLQIERKKYWSSGGVIELNDFFFLMTVKNGTVSLKCSAPQRAESRNCVDQVG